MQLSLRHESETSAHDLTASVGAMSGDQSRTRTKCNCENPKLCMSFGISDAISMVTLIRQVYRNRRIISALFDWEGKRLEGDERLEVEVHYAYGKPQAGSDYWWYSVKPF